MLPYWVVNWLALSPTWRSMARRSFRSSSSRPLSSAILNTRFSTPAWVSFRPSIRPSSSGPMSETVARTGWPCSPNTSHRVVGTGEGLGRRQAPVLEHRGQLLGVVAGLADAGEVALDVGHEDRHADLREILGQGLQGHGLAGAGGAGDEAVPVGHAGQQIAFDLRVPGEQQRFGHGLKSKIAKQYLRDRSTVAQPVDLSPTD